MGVSDDLSVWMDGYRAAWTSNEPADIRALFTDDAEYRYEPWADPVRGADAIVDSWLEGKDEPGDWTFDWWPLARDGATATIEGRTVYLDGRAYRNLWVIELAGDGRASRFTEWYMKEPAELPSVD